MPEVIVSGPVYADLANGATFTESGAVTGNPLIFNGTKFLSAPLAVANITGSTAGAILLGGGAGVALGSLALGTAHKQVRVNAAGTAFGVLGRPDFIPADHGLLAWTFDLALASTSSVITAGTLNLAKIHVPEAMSVTNVHLVVSIAGATLTAGNCFAALYQGGSRLGVSADQQVAWQSTGMKTMALAGGPVAVAAGEAYVGWYYVGTTSPSFARSAIFPNPSALNVGLVTPNLRYATADTGLTTSPPATHTTQTTAAIAFWAAFS